MEKQHDSARQQHFTAQLREMNDAAGTQKYALIETYGCQQNEADSDRMRGMLASCGYLPTKDRAQADLIIFNTCAVREHAELKVFGNVGALKHLKAKKPSLVIGLCGCMMQQDHRTQEILKKHRHIDFILGTHTFHRLPEALLRVVTEHQPVALIENESEGIKEGLPVMREGNVKAYVTIMYGCNNFCSYCVVPYVRGRERSREKEKIIEEVKGLAAEGFKEIMLLGQNVNSYGKGLYEDYGFPELLSELDRIEGEFVISFMTSHPKDATPKLFDVMAEGRHIGHHLHLPVQSGCDRILKLMNRNYTTGDYEKLVSYARKRIPQLSLTSDIIVGFPTETEEEFEQTLAFVSKIKFDSLYTFIYSKRKGTPAAEMEGQISKEEKQRRIAKLIETQAKAAIDKNSSYLGKKLRVRVTDVSSTDKNMLAARTDGGKLTHFAGDSSLVGSFVYVNITRVSPYALYGEIN